MELARIGVNRYFKKSSFGDNISILLGRHQSQGGSETHTVVVVELEPEQSIDPHFHKEREESFYFLEGNGIAIIDEFEISIGAENLIFVRRFERHQIKNSGAIPLKFLVITAPQWVHEDSFY